MLAWLGGVGWSTYEVVLTRTLRADNAWALPDGVAIGMTTFLLALMALPNWTRLERRTWSRASIATFCMGAVTVGLVIWAAEAPLPEQRAVLLPPRRASPQAVVRTFVAAVDEHDGATVDALCAPWWVSSANSSDLGYFINSFHQGQTATRSGFQEASLEQT